jgi:hypothetical protein
MPLKITTRDVRKLNKSKAPNLGDFMSEIYHNSQEKINSWRCGSSGRVPALQAQSTEFKS